MKRRFFISRMALLSAGLFTGSFGVLARPFTRTKKVKGKVTSGKSALSGVVVSDGYSVVATNTKGEYNLELNDNARFVFLSTPAGYEFPEENQIARHYRKAGDIKSGTVNFELKQLDKEDHEHQFMIWADTQPKTKKDMHRMVDETIPDVKQLLSAMPGGTLIHGITVGDIAWDNSGLYPDYCNSVKEVGIPFFQCLGNHDMDLNQGGDEASDRTFNEWFGPTHYSFNRGKVHYIVLDDVRYLGKDKEYDGYISENQLAWLKKDLEFVPKENLLILCAHIPVLRGVKNLDALLAITNGYNMHIMSGHTHLNYNTVRGGIFEHNHGTICGALWTGSICGDGTPNGYAVYTVKGTDLTWYYKSTGYPAEYQMKLYVDKNKDGERELLVNVWNYDPDWKVEYSLNGNNQGAISHIKGYDPMSVLLYEGKDLPAGRGFVDPKITEHLFRAAVPEGEHEIMVTVTDRFGNKYTDSYKTT